MRNKARVKQLENKTKKVKKALSIIDGKSTYKGIKYNSKEELYHAHPNIEDEVLIIIVTFV